MLIQCFIPHLPMERLYGLWNNIKSYQQSIRILQILYCVSFDLGLMYYKTKIVILGKVMLHVIYVLAINKNE
jgi:hypothetical protein